MKYNMAVYVVGDFLRETRLRKGYTQEEVSYGICTPASLSRIENGAQKPGRLILEKLFERLGTENNLFNSFVSREEMELYSAIQELIRDVTDGDIKKIEIQISKVEKLTVNISGLEHQCLLFAKGELVKQRDKDQNKAMELMMKAIHITLPDFDGINPLRSNLLTFDEIMIINSIAVLHAKNGKVMDAIQLEMWLKDYMEDKIVDGKMKTAKYPMILYNLSNWFGIKGCHHEAFQMADLGVDFCVSYGNLAAFPILVSNKGVALAELGEFEEARKYLHQTITVFEAMKKTDRAQAVIDWCSMHYNIKF
ncbi:XRE family transcriptional regulator [Roseburia inulinivorans]|uniref:XRE family transcriptional regulator n=2 Tax=Roseburia inulinivorans TaxID=360807 RepID=A0A3R5VZA9_9FIRM|nr:XRE family transcriptional regulator [Roseburia inulinivorans]